MNKGFSTIEIMIAMVIILSAVSAILMTTFDNQNFFVNARANSEALAKVKKNLEEQEALARKDFRAVNPIISSTDGYYTTWSLVGPSSSLSDYFSKKVTSHIEWTDDSKITRSVQLSTLVTNFKNAIGGDTCNSFLTGDWTHPISSTFSLGTLIGDASGTYPITDIDVYHNKMYITVNQPSQSSPSNNPHSATDYNAVGTISWNTAQNIQASDDMRATATLSGISSTHYIKAANFGFAIPASATILGIKVEVEKSRSGGTTGQVRDNEIKIVKSDGSIGATNNASSSNWSTSEGFSSYGSPSDLWGEHWSPEDINNSNFGVVISATGSSTTTDRIANIDSMRITVTYIKEFYIFDLADPANPILSGTLAENDGIATGFNAVATDGHYAYIATNSGPAGGQLQILDISSATPKVMTTYAVPNVTGTGTQAVGNSIFYHNGYIYLGLAKTASGPEFNIIDAHDPLNPTWVGGYSVGSAVNAMHVRSNVAYITASDTAQEMIVLDIRNPSNPIFKLAHNAKPDQNGFGYGRSEYIVGDTWYLGRTYISNAPEFSALDASSGTPTATITKDTGPNSGSPFSLNKIIVRDYLAFLLTGSGTKGGQLQILNAETASSYASPIAWPNNTTGIGGTSMDCEGNTMYAGSVDSSNNGYVTSITAS